MSDIGSVLATDSAGDAPLRLVPAERTALDALAASPASGPALRQRVAIVLALAEGESTTAIARRLGVLPCSVRRWRRRFATEGLDGLLRHPNHGRAIGEERAAVARVLRILATTGPKRPGARWNMDKVVAATGLPIRRLGRLMRLCGAFGTRWTRADLRGEPALLDETAAVAGLLLAREGRMLAMAIDERPESARSDDRTGTPVDVPSAANGDVAASGTYHVVRDDRLGIRRAVGGLAQALGAVRGDAGDTTPAEERRRFLEAVDAAVPSGCSILLVVDPGADLAEPALAAFLEGRPRFRVFRAASGRRWQGVLARLVALRPPGAGRHGPVHALSRLIGAVERLIVANYGADASFRWVALEAVIRDRLTGPDGGTSAA